MLRRLEGKPSTWGATLTAARRRWNTWLDAEPTAGPGERLRARLEPKDVDVDVLVELRRALR